ncbi:transmembrane protein, putative [Rhizoctonia solani AG-3 Rhs1AP]|uniref:Transmembrane protein, putative n=2 Tax=Rhizoctonia solani AG-3 TaxID=1086053 RepID=X8J1D2_9AGAM|nr:transmembrane protein, putative [Rhizoctonia solani AG-3 Rhs1AP]KEP49607.1 putative transmembrane protein [Rhizoctonia solani 123E]
MSLDGTPYPITSYPSSPLWQLTPVSSNSSAGWAPSCIASDCIPTASWSTGAVNSTLTYMFYAFGHTIYGKVDGDMKLQLIRNGNEEPINPSGGILYTFLGNPRDDDLHQNLTFKVIEASNGARLTVNKAFINGSSYAAQYFPSDEWTLASNDGALQYTGFVQQQATAGLQQVSPTTYVSSAAGDKVSMQFNGSALTIYGPCGPSSGLIRVTIDGREDTTNTTKPLQSDDCLLYQSQGYSVNGFHSFELENVDGRTLAINRLGFFRVLVNAQIHGSTMAAGKVAGIVVGVVLAVAALIILYSTRSRKSRQKINKPWTVLCS